MLAIISDIHANLEALTAVLAAGKELGIDEWVCLGDMVGYGADPNECVELVRARCSVVLLGNHDEAAVAEGEPPGFNPWAAEAILWTQQALQDEHKQYLRERPLRHETDLATYVHSTPIRPEEWEYILSAADALACADGFSTPLCFVGHSHQPAIYELPARTPDGPSRWLVNAGSVGQPRDGDPRACMVLVRPVEGGEVGVQFIRIGYDIGTARRKILRAGLPAVLAHRLVRGL